MTGVMEQLSWKLSENTDSTTYTVLPNTKKDTAGLVPVVGGAEGKKFPPSFSGPSGSGDQRHATARIQSGHNWCKGLHMQVKPHGRDEQLVAQIPELMFPCEWMQLQMGVLKPFLQPDLAQYCERSTSSAR